MFQVLKLGKVVDEIAEHRDVIENLPVELEACELTVTVHGVSIPELKKSTNSL